MRARDGVDVHGGIVSSMHERYGSSGCNQGFLNARVSFGADGCVGLAGTVVGKVGFVALVPRSEVVFQGVHIRRKTRNLAEYKGQVHGDYQRNQVKAAVDNADEVCCVYDLGCCSVEHEQRGPMARSIAGFKILIARYHSGKDEERYQSNIKNGSKDHVAC